jgi:hypothetical protein
MIESYSFGHIVIDGKEYSNDVLILGQRIKNWWRRRGHELCPDDLGEVVSEGPQALVVGTGAYGLVQVPAETREYLESQGIELVVEATDKACDTYNRLCLSQRVAAALHLTC